MSSSLVSSIFRSEQKYYELLIEKSVTSLSIFPYHLADIITKGLRVTPFNYYIRIICVLLKHDKSYDTLPNFTAIDCKLYFDLCNILLNEHNIIHILLLKGYRILGIGRNQYLALVNDFKSHNLKKFRYQSIQYLLPMFPQEIHIECWWKIEIGYVLESDVQVSTKYIISGILLITRLDFDTWGSAIWHDKCCILGDT